ncbi:MAG: DNA mismatch repair protein MutS [Treponema phagedenis]|uniref:DNA mismatch repair protein MutS n=1 Tax=Treponema phagedenis TaxID=162 RepID=UPI0031340F99
MNDVQTPMMRQYQEIKAEHRDAVLFFRLGDFYEMFNEDAIEISKLLNLTLTQRGKNPMCGIPYHAAKIYIARLLRAGKKIAICEQVSNPVPGELTKRRVVEIITPGTAVEDDFLEQGKANYLAAVYCTPKKYRTEKAFDFYIGFAYIDVSTGYFFATSFPLSEFADNFKKEMGKIQPKEILIQQSLPQEIPELKNICAEYPDMFQNLYPDWSYNPKTAEKRLCMCFGTENLKAFSLTVDSPEVPPAGLLLEYLEQTSGAPLSHVTGISVYGENDFVTMDDSTRKNLEILQNIRDGTSAYSVFETLSYTKTSMGARLLRYRLHRPLRDKAEIQKRLEKTDVLYKNQRAFNRVQEYLSDIFDIERLAGRLAMERAHAKDLLALKQSLNACISLNRISAEESLFFLKLSDLEVQKLIELFTLLENSILEDCSIIFTEGKLIKRGFSEKLDELYDMRNNATSILEQYLLEEQEATGIHNLKIKYNRMLGYFLEVTKGNLKSVPDHFIRRRSLANADRFTTDKLVDIETKLNNVDENIIACERDIFFEIRSRINKENLFLRKLAAEIAELDVFQSFAQAASIHGWVKPSFVDDGQLEIIAGRHPVVEKHLPAGEFIPNDLHLSSESDSSLPSFALITGPNMAGKSTYLRQTALIVLLAQIGSFVPAEKAVITPVDCIFCRVGASDNLARGESTFLVEMTETAYILRSATQKSLVIMDEVGRGTSTEDGLSIARAVSEYLLNKIGAKTLFATHYHELSYLEHPRLKNFCLDVLETEEKIVFLKKVIEGVSNNSYGIHVARLAGVPESVLARAQTLLDLFAKTKNQNTTADIISPAAFENHSSRENSNTLFSEEDMIINEIISLNPDSITPLEALQLVTRWKNNLYPQK